MKAIFPILLCVTIFSTATGQEADEKSELDDKVQKAIRDFNIQKNGGKEPVKEVAVVLPPPEPLSSRPEDVTPAAIPAEEVDAEAAFPNQTEPTLVTGTPPSEQIAEQVDPTQPEISATQSEASSGMAPAGEKGLAIRVEAVRDGKDGTELGQIKLRASFPAKALSTTPNGWILEKSKEAPVFLEEVTLRPGKTITLSISPHVLAPAADGENTFGVVEPGFAGSEGYRQSNTVSAILGNSVVQLDRDALLLGNAISDLHQLLSSLPKTEPEDLTKP